LLLQSIGNVFSITISNVEGVEAVLLRGWKYFLSDTKRVQVCVSGNTAPADAVAATKVLAVG
jgi:hypothetical protein